MCKGSLLVYCGVLKPSRGEEVRIKCRDGGVNDSDVMDLGYLQRSVLNASHTFDLVRVITGYAIELRA